MIVRAPRMKAKQNSSVLIHNLPEKIVFGNRLWQAKQRPVTHEAAGCISDPDDRPKTLHSIFPPRKESAATQAHVVSRIETTNSFH